MVPGSRVRFSQHVSVESARPRELFRRSLPEALFKEEKPLRSSIKNEDEKLKGFVFVLLIVATFYMFFFKDRILMKETKGFYYNEPFFGGFICGDCVFNQDIVKICMFLVIGIGTQ